MARRVRMVIMGAGFVADQSPLSHISIIIISSFSIGLDWIGIWQLKRWNTNVEMGWDGRLEIIGRTSRFEGECREMKGKQRARFGFGFGFGFA